ncbi:MAG: TetR/AcrR family transcriptional regulator [Desulfatitalea sp.]|nr:TetR/AcrR family transcriptional regulator [Desulfatitalea sp.]
MAKDRKTATRRAQILKAAEKIFAEKGFHEATISEIAKGAGLSEPTIYEYFPSKEEILFQIPAETSCRLGELIRFHLQMAKGTASKLRALIYILFWIHQTDPNYAAVSYLILRQNSRFINTEAYRTLRENLRPLMDVIKEGIEAGEIKSSFTPYFIRSVILGSIEHLTTRKLLMGTEDNLLDYVDSLVELVMGGAGQDNNPGVLRFNVTVRSDAVQKTPVSEVAQPKRRCPSKSRKRTQTNNNPGG